MAETKKQFILYDGRATPDGPGDASVLVCCDDDQEACSYKGDFGGMTCFSYDVQEQPGCNPDRLINEQFEWNWFPGDPK
tara:strand:+ start:711 stop:947 length:237 start_codon:yes stop_codon:yes gene_type:complete